ncbi:MAG: hypothetical protein ACFFC7_05730 [Candidatus Hermodarchaeota archaeon]
MTGHSNQMKLKSVSGREEEDFEIKEAPIHSESVGRPTWWFTGSLFKPRTVHEQRLARLQYQTLARDNPILSNRAQRIRQYIGFLSQWFPISILDEIGKEILEIDIRQNDECLLAHLLGVLETILRQRHCTIRWSVLQEINQAIGSHLEKKDIYKWMFYTRQRKKERISDTLFVVQHLTIEAILIESLPTEQKRQLCVKVAHTIKVLRLKGFVCKDPEITSWALKRILLEEKGSQTNVPRDLRSATTRMTFRLRKMLKNN